ncbi:MAG TPA: translation elongation factor Ts [Coxiellaceae bacterium]|nr:translation elongation factor Ts [Coxiellaceae bacterium]
MTITAQQVAELRRRTDAPMMDCKKALVETQGDIEAAEKWMREQGKLKAAKRSVRTAAEGRVLMKIAASRKKAILIEINCETDFVAKDESFVRYCELVAQRVLEEDEADIETIKSMSLENGVSIEEARQTLVAKLGENIQLRRLARLSSNYFVSGYSHGHRIGVIVAIDKSDEALAKDISMHIAASRPMALDKSNISEAVLNIEREIYFKQSQDSGKPEHIIAKMVEGRIQKYIKENCLLGQPFVKNPDQTVEALLKAKDVRVEAFIRFEVGEGIEKEVQDFAAEVQAQMKGV